MMRSLILSLLLILTLTQNASASYPLSRLATSNAGGWLSWIASLFTTAARYAPLAGPKGTAVGAGLGAIQVVLKFVDQVIEQKKLPTYKDPPSKSCPPKTPSYSYLLPASIHFADLSTPFPDTLGFIDASNCFIGSSNEFFDAARGGADTSALIESLSLLRNDLFDTGVEYDKLGLNISISQAGIFEAQADFLANGLPASEIDFLVSSGFSSIEIADFTHHVATSDLCVSADVSVSELFDDSILQLTTVPEPASVILWLIAGSCITFVPRMRRKKWENR